MADSPENRIERLEALLLRFTDEGMAPIPIAWAEIDPFNNEPIGPPPDATAAQLRSWATVLPMLMSVPYVPAR